MKKIAVLLGVLLLAGSWAGARAQSDILVYDTDVNFNLLFGDRIAMPAKGYAVVEMYDIFTEGNFIVYWTQNVPYVTKTGKTMTQKVKFYSTSGLAMYMPAGFPGLLMPLGFLVFGPPKTANDAVVLSPAPIGDHGSLWFSWIWGLNANNNVSVGFGDIFLGYMGTASGNIRTGNMAPSTMRGISQYVISSYDLFTKETANGEDGPAGTGYGTSRASINKTYSFPESATSVEEVVSDIIDDLEDAGYIDYDRFFGPI